MSALKLCVLLVIACCGILNAQAQSASPTPTPVLSPMTGSGADGSTITKEELEAIVAEIKQEIASNPTLAAVFDGIDPDALLKMTPEEARKTLNDKVFGGVNEAPSSSSSSTAVEGSGSSTAPDSTSSSSQVDGSSDTSKAATSTPTSAVAVPVPAPAPAGSAGPRAVFTSATAAVVTLAITVIYMA